MAECLRIGSGPLEKQGEMTALEPVAAECLLVRRIGFPDDFKTYEIGDELHAANAGAADLDGKAVVVS